MASVRQKIIDVLIGRLEGITKAAGYSRNVGKGRVKTSGDISGSLPTPSVVLLQADEEISKQYSDRYECKLSVDILFMDTGIYSDSAAEAVEFMADIQKAMQVEFTIQAKRYPDPTIVSGMANMFEVGSAIEVSDATPALIVGRVSYDITYRRSIYDPNQL